MLLRGATLLFLAVSCILLVNSWAWTTTTMPSARLNSAAPLFVASSNSGGSWFTTTAADDSSSIVAEAPSEVRKGVTSIQQLKIQLLQLGAALDRGQAYNPTSGAYYKENMDVARSKIGQLLDQAAADNRSNEGGEESSSIGTVPSSLEAIGGEWELILTTVPHGIFRSSPFFLAIQEAYEYAETKTFEDGTSKPGLFFKLHELQTCSWGVSKVGRIAQHIDASKKYLYSTFDTSIFSLTVFPFIGWGKIFPTFGGSVVTAATCAELTPDTFDNRSVARLDMVVDYTTSRKIEGLSGLPLLQDIIWKIKVPVGQIWKLLPWNKGREATCKVYINYADDDFRIVQDGDGEYFVYTRPVVPRPLDLMSK